uniref:Androgen induced inhibitor of proliferation (As3) / pds5, putative n=1 Tax=Arundo donax TaxID=35708 RepID=A0A0A9GJ90_ARUDO
MRVLAPDPPFSNEIFKEIFRLFISIFADLAETSSPYITRRMKILETFAALRCSIIMVNIGCEDLILDMVKIFFSSVKEHATSWLLTSFKIVPINWSLSFAFLCPRAFS